MPKTLVDIDDFEPIEGDYEDLTGVQGDIDEQLDQIISEIGGDGNAVEYAMKVYRPQPGKGKLGYLFSCMHSELPILDRLRDEYGGGDFEVRIFRDGKIFRRRTCIVEPPPKKLVAPVEQLKEMQNVAQVMAQGFERLGSLMVTQQNNGGMKEMLESMVLMKQVMGEVPVVDPVTQLKGILEIQQMVTGNNTADGTETNVNDVLLSLAETVLPKLAEAATAPQGISPEKPEKPEKPKTLNSEPQGSESPMKMHLVFLTQQAKRNADPTLYAQIVLDHTPDDKLDSLLDFMEGENCIEEMVKIHKAVGEHKEWFAKLAEAILSLVEVVEENPMIETLTEHIQAANKESDAPTKNSEPHVIPDTRREAGNETRHENNAPIDTTREKESRRENDGG